jgi:divalent metal cation (Fe/Co/Zn/Cd) transporter
VALHLKFPADVDLETAAAAAARVEAEIVDTLPVTDVQTHLEPLERTVAARAPSTGGDARTRERAVELLSERLGSPPQSVRVLPVDGGRVVFVTVVLEPAESLAGAHALAGELEELLRANVAGIVEVVIHTSP